MGFLGWDGQQEALHVQGCVGEEEVGCECLRPCPLPPQTGTFLGSDC